MQSEVGMPCASQQTSEVIEYSRCISNRCKQKNVTEQSNQHTAAICWQRMEL